MTGLARELSSMPTAIASEAFRRTQLSVLRTPSSDPSVATLQFFAGQRIVGIEFPARFNGEWALGWVDNVRGAFPVDCVKLEAPSEREVRKTNVSPLRAVARWKRHPKEKEVKEGGWLRFEKGEVISNISCEFLPNISSRSLKFSVCGGSIADGLALQSPLRGALVLVRIQLEGEIRHLSAVAHGAQHAVGDAGGRHGQRRQPREQVWGF